MKEHLFFFGRGYPTGAPLWAALLEALPRRGAQQLAGVLRDLPNLFWEPVETDSRPTVSHAGIFIYIFIAPTIFVQSRDCLRLFT